LLTNCNPYFDGLSVSDGDDAVNAGHINVALVRVIVGFFSGESRFLIHLLGIIVCVKVCGLTI